MKTPTAVVISIIGVALLAGTAAAAPVTGTPVDRSAAGPLTADTAAGCNTTPRPGFARCLALIRTATPGQVRPQAAGPPATALGPADIRSAYRLPAGGGGQTVAIVDAYGDSHAEDDLAVFRSFYGLAPCTVANGCFRRVDQTGGTSYPADDPGWGEETSLDLDAVSAACPACNILLVEGNDESLDSLGAAVDTAVSLGAKYVSNSYGVAGEDPSEVGYDEHYNHAGVAVVVSSGDEGNVTSWPSTNPHVISVGGTLLSRDPSTGRGWTESAWGSSTGGQGGGSGCSPYEPHPDYQSGVDTNCPAGRASADIAVDADPASGLATYDTLGMGGWLQIGGTSLSSPLVAAMYALAGPPLSADYPVADLYHDPRQADDLFDIVQGANGGCANVLCQAGTGWDGPTGLGSPDGVGALTAAPHGTLTGRVTDAATGQPLTGATVSANPGGYATRTDSDGGYRLDLRSGTYDVAVAKYGYLSTTGTGVAVSAGNTGTRDFALAAQPSTTLSGTVTDGSGHGWPLHARIGISGYPDGAVYTDPVTGRYSVTLPQGDYTLDISTDAPGYRQETQQISIGAGGATRDVALDIDQASCTAPGYGLNGAGEDFTGWAAATPRDGWTVTGRNGGWRFDNPANRSAPQTPPDFQTGGDDDFAIADSGTGGRLDTTLNSPVLDLSRASAPRLEFDTNYYAAPQQSATVELSVDGGRSWAPVWHQTTTNAIGHVSVALPATAGRRDVRVRFHYTGHGGWYWAVDNVLLGARTCVARPGGMIVGVVSDRATHQPLNGAQVTSSADPAAHAWPAGTASVTGDPAVAGGYYWLFTPTGGQQVTASASGYDPLTATLDIAADRVVRHDVALTRHGS